MKSTFYICIASLIFFVSCKKEYPEPVDKILSGRPTGLILGTNYVSHSGNKLVIESDIRFVSDGEGYDDLTIPDSVFHDASFYNHTLQVDSIYPVSLTESNPYSHLILIDESPWGWDVQEYHVSRYTVRSLNKTLRETLENSENQIAIGSFSRYMNYTDPAFIWRGSEAPENPMNQEYDNHAEALYKYTEEYFDHNNTDNNLYHNNSNLYDALNLMIDSLSLFAKNDRKFITVISYNAPDTLNLITVNEVAQKAITNNIIINVICIQGVSWDVSWLALTTGGFVHMVTNTFEFEALFELGNELQVSPVLASLHPVLSGTVSFKRVRFTLTKSGPWLHGETVYDTYQILEREPDGSLKMNNFIPIYVQIP